MNGFIEVAKWLGYGNVQIDPATMQYRARLASGVNVCRSCVFKGQKSNVCLRAAALAVMSGQPDCDDIDKDTGKSFIYVEVDRDDRQLNLLHQ